MSILLQNYTSNFKSEYFIILHHTLQKLEDSNYKTVKNIDPRFIKMSKTGEMLSFHQNLDVKNVIQDTLIIQFNSNFAIGMTRF